MCRFRVSGFNSLQKNMSKKSPRVSAFIPSYNHAAYLGEAIESILGQSMEDFELIIVDDGSTDNSWELIEHYAKSDSRIVAIRQENQGPSAATNRALKQAKGEFIAAHTSDDRSASTRLEMQVAYLDTHAEYDAVGSFIEEIDGNGQVKASGQYESWFNVPIDINDPSSWVWRNMVASPTLMLRRSFFERYGNYDRDLVYTQDWEIWIRALSMGAKFAILSEKLFQYRSHGDNLTHKNATQTFWEYAYISSKTLHPWLKETDNDGLILRNIDGFLRHDEFVQLNQNERAALASALLHDFKGTFQDFFLSRNDDLASHQLEAKKVIEAYGHIQLERDRLQAERDQLQAEMSTLTYQATKKVRHVLHTRLPWAYRFVGRLLHFAHRVWRFRATDGFLILRTKLFETRTVVNVPWQKDKPLMSIIIPCFNYGKYLNEAIDSVLNQTFQDFEIIVVDDESTDPYTQEVIASLDRPKTRVIQQKNQRVSMARNNGIREARGKYVCCLDADDLLTPTYLEKCLYWLETEHLDICYSWVQLFGDSDFLWHTAPFSIDDLMQGNIVSTTAVFRKSFWEKTDGYKQQMRHGYEDWEFWLTMARHGARGHRIPEPLFLYRKHGPSLTTQTDPVHDKLCTDIQALHADIYSDPASLVDAKRRQFRNYIVKNPLINLLRHPDSLSQTRNPSTLNILLSVPWFDLGGSSVLMKEVFSQLVMSGVRATAVATNPSDEIQADEGLSLYESFTPDCFNLPSFLGNKEAVVFVEYLIKSRKIDIVFLVGSRLVYESLPRLKTLFPDLKVVDQLYNTVGHVKSNREFSRYIDLNLVANEEVRDRLLELGETTERIQVIPHGINTAEFSPTDCHYLAQLARRTERQFTFGFMGRLSSEKRPQDIVQLAVKLPECHFRIRGEGPMEDMLRKQVLAQGLADRVHFDARFENPIEFFAGLDALLVPSEIEGLPLVLLEAMALELPVIATKVGHIPMAISDGENGFLYESGDIVHLCEIAQRLTQLLPNERKKIGKRARQTILEGYTIAKCASSYFDAFNRLLA